MVADELIDRLDDETGVRLAAQGREGRRRALATISEVRVLLTRDGEKVWEETFERPPTLDQIVQRAGRDAFIVSVRMAPKPVRQAQMPSFRRALPIAAE